MIISTFSQLLEKYQLVIPMLQRDYAQGRSDPRSTQVRKEFVSAIKRVLTVKSAVPLDLGLIYGSQAEGRMVLLDGQQRATTLYLLHWYLAMCTGSAALPFPKFENFIYETRTTSRDFCRALCDCIKRRESEHSQVSLGNVFKDDFSAWIGDQSWFFRTWKSDPTVASMVTMLAEIHDQFNACDADVCLGKLIDSDNTPIRFQFLDIQQHGMTDEVYIKINARGRPLTEFEKFKAWLEETLKDGASEWASKMDNQWMDFFWDQSAQKDNPERSQRIFYKFLKEVAVARVLAEKKPQEQGNGDLEKSLKGVLEGNGDAFVKTEILKTLFDPKSWEYISGALDSLVAPGNNIAKLLNGVTFFSGSTSGPWGDLLPKGKIDYTQCALLHALCCFFEYRKGDFTHLAEWMRICRNLTANSSVSNYEGFAEIAKSIRWLSKVCLQEPYNPIPNLAKITSIDSSRFENGFSIQLEEEIRKAKLISLNADWGPAIKEMEALSVSNDDGQHYVFHGCIRIFIDASGESLEEFRALAKSAEHLLRQIDQSYRLIRATLSKAGAIHLGQILLGEAVDNWRERLTKKTEPDSPVGMLQDAFIKLLREHRNWAANKSKDDALSFLDEVIASYRPKSGQYVWMDEIIRNGDRLLEDCHTQLKKVERHSSGNIYLYSSHKAVGDVNISVSDKPKLILFSEQSVSFFKLIDALLGKNNSHALCSARAVHSDDDHNYYKGDHIRFDLLDDLHAEFHWGDNDDSGFDEKGCKREALVVYLNENPPTSGKKFSESCGIRWELNLQILLKGSFNDQSVHNELSNSLEQIPRDSDIYAKLEKLIEKWRDEKVSPS